MAERISRRDFLKLAGVGAGGAFLTACGVIPSEPLPTQQPLPTEIPLPTLTPTTEPSPTPEITPTPEAPVYEAGTLYIDPEYDLDRRVETISENVEAFRNYLLDTLYNLGPDSFQTLELSNGTRVTGLETLLVYLEENDWVIPENIVRLAAGGGESVNTTLTEPLNGMVSLRQISIQIIDYETYQREVADYQQEDPLIRGRYLITPYDGPEEGYAVRVAVTPHLIGETYTLAIQIVNSRQHRISGFPSGSETLTPEQVSKLDCYARFILYVMRSMQTNPPTQYVAERLARGAMGVVYPINREPGVGKLSYPPEVYGYLLRNILNDTPPSILRGVANPSS
jgi:hypothetical protein